MSVTKIAICGSRSVTDYNVLVEALSEAVSKDIIPTSNTYVVVSGGAMGVDSLARTFAVTNGHQLIEIVPDYSTGLGRVAPLERNKKIAAVADVLVAIHDGKSTGTLHMISAMKKLNKPVYVKTLD